MPTNQINQEENHCDPAIRDPRHVHRRAQLPRATGTSVQRLRPPAIKSRWFTAPDEGPEHRELQFRVGGRELNRGNTPDGAAYTFGAHYMDIVPDNRIVYAYDMHLNQTRISASLATVELTPAGTGTRLVYTEQGAFLDGLDTPAARQHGTSALLDALGAELDRQTANT